LFFFKKIWGTNEKMEFPCFKAKLNGDIQEIKISKVLMDERFANDGSRDVINPTASVLFRIMEAYNFWNI